MRPEGDRHAGQKVLIAGAVKATSPEKSTLDKAYVCANIP